MTLGRAARGLAAVVGAAVLDPASIPRLRDWINSLTSGRTALGDGMPWLSYRSRVWLEQVLGPQSSVFEYGSGGSTLFLARLAGRVISVEHDPAWHLTVTRALAERGASNVECLLVEPESASVARPAGGGESWALPIRRYPSTAVGYEGMSFERYVRAIDPFPDASFDLVLVDGRARNACVTQAVSKVRAGGYLMLDDSERDEYQPAMRVLAAHPRTDLMGIGPYKRMPWQSSVWRIGAPAGAKT